jgi:hypothetical protein
MMMKKVMITLIVLVIIAGLAITAHMTDFIGIFKRMHGG